MVGDDQKWDWDHQGRVKVNGQGRVVCDPTHEPRVRNCKKYEKKGSIRVDRNTEFYNRDTVEGLKIKETLTRSLSQ